MTDGAHTLSGTGPPRSASGGPPPPSNSSGGLGCFLYAAFVFVLFLGSLGGGQQRSNSITSSTPAPNFKSATFTGIPKEDGKPLTITLGGGTAAIQYISLALLKLTVLEPPVATADFDTGKITGDLSTANTVILHGDCNLDVGDIYSSSKLVASIINKGKNINAYFNYDNSARGPPTKFSQVDNSPMRNFGKQIKVITTGTIHNIAFGKAFGTSSRDIKVYDLDPKKEDITAYNESISKSDTSDGFDRSFRPSPGFEPRVEFHPAFGR